MQRRPPSHAWSWFQRSRPVVAEAAMRLTGGPPAPGFVEDLRSQYDRDPFTRDIVNAVVADVAFGGRIPVTRPAGVSWDRGLTWWASALAGVTPAEFERRHEPPGEQRSLFGGQHQQTAGPEGRADAGLPGRWDDQAREQTVRRFAARSPERAALRALLEDLLGQADGDQIPASAVRSLIAELE